jgi:hypothetical protein
MAIVGARDQADGAPFQMSFLMFQRIVSSVLLLSLVMAAGRGYAQGEGAAQGAVPRVLVPTASRPTAPTASPRPLAPAASGALYPWRLHVTITVFWIGEQPTDRNPVANTKSSWDQNWMANFGGYDDPEPVNRIANHTTGEFRPKAFVPKLNTFYVALPYNDVVSSNQHKSEASRVIPWFLRLRPQPGETVCKGRWLQIYNGRRSCYAQWEDCGPWVTDDWEYVFGNKPPQTTQNGAAGLDVSPAVRDFLTLTSGKKVHWRFVEDGQVPNGPWKKYGNTQTSVSQPFLPGQRLPDNADLETQRRYMEYLRKLRDDEYLKKPLSEIQR